MSKKLLLGFAAAITLLPVAANAQNDDVAERANELAEQAGDLANDVATSEADARTETAAGVEDEGDEDGDAGSLGLLGLLGLAGLLGLRRRDNNHVDTDTRTGTRL